MKNSSLTQFIRLFNAIWAEKNYTEILKDILPNVDEYNSKLSIEEIDIVLNELNKNSDRDGKIHITIGYYGEEEIPLEKYLVDKEVDKKIFFVDFVKEVQDLKLNIMIGNNDHTCIIICNK